MTTETLTKHRLLCVDDEPNVLSGFVRHLRKDFQVMVAESGEEALQVIREEPAFAVICSDYNMPGMDGVAFLRASMLLSPDSTRVLLTGRTDLNVAINGINEGGIFRFLLKPCPPETLNATLLDAARQYELLSLEKVLLERTLAGSVKLLMELLSLANPVALSRGNRIRQVIQSLLFSLHLPDPWQYEMAAGLSHIGCLALPQELLEKAEAGRPLSPQEQQRYVKHPELAAQLLQHIPRLEEIAEMIRRQCQPATVLRPVELHALPRVELGAQMLRLAIAYDEELAQGRNHDQAMNALRKELHEFHPQLILALERLQPGAQGAPVRKVTLEELRTRMVINQEVRGANGVLLLSRGQEVNAAVLERLRLVARQIGVAEPIEVLVPDTQEAAYLQR